MYISCVCERHIYTQQPVTWHSYCLLRLPRYCVLPNLQRVQQSKSFSRKTKSTLFFLQGDVREGGAILSLRTKKTSISYSILFYCSQRAYTVYSWRTGRISSDSEMLQCILGGSKKVQGRVHEGVTRRPEGKVKQHNTSR